MSVQELRAESQRRGLGTARSRTELVDRLTTNDAATEESSLADFDDVAPQPAVNAPAAQPPVTAKKATPTPEPADSPASYRMTFSATPGGPDEEDHLAYRQATRQAAIDAGYTPRGDARRTGTVDGHEVYEISVRRAP